MDSLSDFPLPHPVFSDPAHAATLRKVLLSAGFNRETICTKLAIEDFPSLSAKNLHWLLKQTDDGHPLDTLVRLFLIDVPVDPELARQAFAPLPLPELYKIGILQECDHLVRATIKLLPFDNCFMAFDLPAALTSDQREHYVMGVGASTLTLANLTVRSPTAATLDLGCGCGFHALLAASHSDQVSALDINPRASQFTIFNAQLNNLANITTLTGNLFEPVAGRMFDLIVSNPPFVISPESRYTYRDGGLPADTLVRKIARQAPDFLNQGGYCQILCNWAEFDGQEWQEHLREWFVESGCDVWVLRSESRNPETYADTWIKHTEKDDAEYGDRFERWLAYYQEQGIVSFGAGIITMRRRDAAANWFRAEDGPARMIGPCGDGIIQGFQSFDFLENTDTESLLLSKLKVAPEVRLERQSTPTPTGWQEQSTRLYRATGLAYSVDIDPFIANLVCGCSGQNTLSRLLTDMAAALDQDPLTLIAPFCKIVRGLVERGFLLPPQGNIS